MLPSCRSSRGNGSVEPAQVTLESLSHTRVFGQELLKFCRGQHEGIATERQAIQRPCTQSFVLRPTCQRIDENQIEITAHGCVTAAVATEDANAYQIRLKPALIFSPVPSLSQHLLR